MRRELGYVLFSYLFNLPHPPLPPPNSPLADSGHLLFCHRTAEQLLIKPANHNREGGGECEGWEQVPLCGDGIESHLHFGGGTQGRQVCLYPHGAPPRWGRWGAINGASRWAGSAGRLELPSKVTALLQFVFGGRNEGRRFFSHQELQCSPARGR